MSRNHVPIPRLSELLEHPERVSSLPMEAVPAMLGDDDRHDGVVCLNCGVSLPQRRRRGSAKKYCTARCRKLAWLGRTQSVPDKVGHVAHKRERLGRLTDRAGAEARVSGRTLRRVIELDKLVREMFGQDKAEQLRRDMLAGNTAPVTTMLRAIKSQMAVQA